MELNSDTDYRVNTKTIYTFILSKPVPRETKFSALNDSNRVAIVAFYIRLSTAGNVENFRTVILVWKQRGNGVAKIT